MRLLWSATALIGIFVAGCAETSVPGESPMTNEEGTASVQPPGESAPAPPQPPPGTPHPGTPRPKEPDPDPPGALGSPIDYDSTQVGGRDRAPKGVKESVEGELDEKTKHCAQKRCGIKVVIAGKGACAVSLSPDPVNPRGVITIGTSPCTDAPPEQDENTPAPGKTAPSNGN